MGLAIFVLLVPLQSKVMSWQINVRKKSMKWTDARSRMLQELLASFSIIKYFTSENAYLERIRNTRDTELVGVWKVSLIKAGNQGETRFEGHSSVILMSLLPALALSLPTLAAVVAFLTYIGVGNTLNPARLFTALSLFQLLRQPVSVLLLCSLSSFTDCSYCS